MSMTVTHPRRHAPHIRRPNRRPIVRILAAELLLSTANRVAYHPGDASPCCPEERLYSTPHVPGYLVCSNDGNPFPAATR